MITRFDGSYAGHIDIDNVGYSGTAVNDRRFSNEQLATVFDKGRDIAKLLDRVGTIPSGPPNTIFNLRATSASPTS